MKSRLADRGFVLSLFDGRGRQSQNIVDSLSIASKQTVNNAESQGVPPIPLGGVSYFGTQLTLFALSMKGFDMAHWVRESFVFCFFSGCRCCLVFCCLMSLLLFDADSVLLLFMVLLFLNLLDCLLARSLAACFLAHLLAHLLARSLACLLVFCVVSFWLHLFVGLPVWPFNSGFVSVCSLGW